MESWKNQHYLFLEVTCHSKPQLISGAGVPAMEKEHIQANFIIPSPHPTGENKSLTIPWWYNPPSNHATIHGNTNTTQKT